MEKVINPKAWGELKKPWGLLIVAFRQKNDIFGVGNELNQRPFRNSLSVPRGICFFSVNIGVAVCRALFFVDEGFAEYTMPCDGGAMTFLLDG